MGTALEYVVRQDATSRPTPLLLLQCNVRDFDYYGAAYTILSAIATGGVNAVVCDIAARDEARNEGAALLTLACN